ncbi:hypothetical protein ACJZ2D_003334 [Fusarium nematophilum]
MRTTRYSISRQKACQQCATAKAKCDRKPGSCARCETRGMSCIYTQTSSSRSTRKNIDTRDEAEATEIISSPDLTISTDDSLQTTQREAPTGQTIAAALSSGSVGIESNYYSVDSPSHPLAGIQALSASIGVAANLPDSLNFSDLHLVCNIKPEDISNRWLNTYVPVPGQKSKDYPASISAFIYRTLKSYGDSAIRGHKVPPFVHSSLRGLPSNQPLSTCLSVIRICQEPLLGSHEVAIEVLQREMNKIHERHATYDDVTSLAAFQAYLIYAMVMFFRLSDLTSTFLRQAMMNLQEIACSTCQRGLTCLAEQQGTRPKWEAWIVAEAKRRTLFTMYLFDSALSTQDGLPTFLGTELQGLFSPGSKTLWNSSTRRGWEVDYNIHLAKWTDGYLHIEELWPMPSDWEECRVADRRRRVDLWLEDVDEYGMMMYAVTSCTHGG